MKPSFLATVLILSPMFVSLLHAEKTNDPIVTRIYYIEHPGVEQVAAVVRKTKHGESGALPTDAEWKTFFQKMGISWPADSDVTFNALTSRLVISNTESNLVAMERTLGMGPTPMVGSDFEFEVDFVLFNKKQIEELSRTKPLNTVTMLGLYTSGNGELVAAPVMRTKSGCESTIKGVVEYIYPSSFEDGGVTNVITPAGTNTTAVVTNEAPCIPSDFVTREVGVILNILPEVAPSGDWVNLTVKPQMVFPPTWRDYGKSACSSDDVKHRSRMEQPFFPVASIEQNITTRLNSTVLMGGGLPSPDGAKMLYLFLRVRKVDRDGNPLSAVDY